MILTLQIVPPRDLVIELVAIHSLAGYPEVDPVSRHRDV
jgi:hypothetical protein